MTRRTGLCASLAALLCVSASGAVPHSTDGVLPSLVIVVDGAGGFEAASRLLRQTAAEEKLPLDVRAFHWSHGYWRVLSDQMHAAHARREGHKLAELVMTCRQESPTQPIYLVGHSAGSAVVLIAVESLPPNAVQRIVLLAPAVSAKRDLRPALRCACQGVDVFTSTHDWAWLGLGTLLTGTADRRWTLATAGRGGFQPPLTGAEDEVLYSKLRQYPWNPQLTWSGHNGGHYGAYQPGFLRVFVLPLLNAAPAEPRPCIP
jgi:pimeloyl-ACP methyl ester carboxylesterase